MLLAVMGSGSHLKRRWDENEHDESESQQPSISAPVTEADRRFSVDLPSPFAERLPPLLVTHERPQVLRQNSWTTSAEGGGPPNCKASPGPHTERPAKRPRLFYSKKESEDAESFDCRSSISNSSVRTLASTFSQPKSNAFATVTMC